MRKVQSFLGKIFEKVKSICGMVRKSPIISKTLLFLFVCGVVICSNLYLQWSQNNHNTTLMWNFALSWHTEKFLLGCFVLLIFFLWLYGIAGSVVHALLFYIVGIGLLGYADYLKMYYRMEPVYPDDLQMITEFGILREMIGTGPFLIALLLLVGALGVLLYSIYRSFFLPKKKQMIRCGVLLLSSILLVYIGNFNSENNLLRKAYNRTALWIPYSQKMNYYNTGFVGGFLYNLKVTAMEKPADYSEAKIDEIVKKYQNTAKENNAVLPEDEAPNIVYIMSESFSDPTKLAGFTLAHDPLATYRTVARNTYSGQMLSQNYGGGTANIEFEALTGLSMEPLNSQMTTPYTMLVNNLDKMPSLVSFLAEQDYQTTAIHPYNTSMYKRKDVYEKLGFQTFLDESTMTHTEKIQENPYISDAAAYEEVMDILGKEATPQFIHLVTMQTHMPYGDKYTTSDYTLTEGTASKSIANYAQDIAYSSEALEAFLTNLKSLNRRTIVVFWGDHLPSIYSDEIKAQNADLTLHETEFLMYDSANQKSFANTGLETVTSPIYYAADLAQKGQLKISGFYQLLSNLQSNLPAFEKGFYQDAAGNWESELSLTKEEAAVYEAYTLIEYDIVAGKQYSVKKDFFEIQGD